MADQIEFEPSSWIDAGGEFTSASPTFASTVNDVVAQTTNASAVGAAGGYALVDGAVTILLGILAEVMGEVVPDISGGLQDEGDALKSVGENYQAAERHGVEQSNRVMW